MRTLVAIAVVYATVSAALAAYWIYSYNRVSTEESRSELREVRWAAVFGWPLLLTLGPLASFYVKHRRSDG